MDEKIRNALHKKISQRFPEIQEQKPQITLQPTVEGQSEKQYLLLYKTSIQLPQGKTLPRVIRVIATAQGKIVKTTTSR